MATHSSVLAWEILCTEEPDRLQFMELQRAGHDLVTKQQQYYSQCEDSEVFGWGKSHYFGKINQVCVTGWISWGKA